MAREFLSGEACLRTAIQYSVYFIYLLTDLNWLLQDSSAETQKAFNTGYSKIWPFNKSSLSQAAGMCTHFLLTCYRPIYSSGHAEQTDACLCVCVCVSGR